MIPNIPINGIAALIASGVILVLVSLLAAWLAQHWSGFEGAEKHDSPTVAEDDAAKYKVEGYNTAHAYTLADLQAAWASVERRREADAVVRARHTDESRYRR